MMTHKYLKHSRRRIAAGALGVQESVTARLRRTAGWSPIEAEREAAAHALAVLAARGWGAAGWEALGLPVRTCGSVPLAAGLARAQGVEQ